MLNNICMSRQRGDIGEDVSLKVFSAQSYLKKKKEHTPSSVSN